MVDHLLASSRLNEIKGAVDQEGFAVVPGLLSPEDTDALLAALDEGTASKRTVRQGGVRNILEAVQAARDVAASPALRSLVDTILGPSAIAVRGILFDKTPAANWKVPWHQDLSIAVRRKVDLPGFGPWTQKGGICHVQPPVSYLEQMLTIRIHLDDCGEDNGPVRVLPGTHRLGRLDAAAIEVKQATQEPRRCTASKGAALLMRPLLLHASSPATTPRHRRVLHLEYANCTLPQGLDWQTAIASRGSEPAPDWLRQIQ